MKRFRMTISVDVELDEGEFFAHLPWDTDVREAMDGLDPLDLLVDWQLHEDAEVVVMDRSDNSTYRHKRIGIWEKL